jgi:8-oxo-dGTP pyrophosphatase MutT (NUDIX family)
MISSHLAGYKAKKDEKRHSSKRSAVAVVLDSDQLETASVLMIQRAKHESDPWSGHMALPGGRHEQTDSSLLNTAKREMLEEVGLDIDVLNAHKAESGLVARLSDRNTFRSVVAPMVVSPYVFVIDEKPKLTANYEVADIVWIPLQYFLDFENRISRKMAPELSDKSFPCYLYDKDQIVWWLSLAIIEDMLRGLGHEFPAWF